MNFKPTLDNVVVRQISKENETASGIFIPNARSNDEKMAHGEILSVGPGKIVNGIQHKLEVEVGNKAIYSNYHAREVTIDGEKVHVIKEEKILAVY